LEVQELGEGKVVVVCAIAHEKNITAGKKNSNRLIKTGVNQIPRFGIAVFGEL
jgi:hypothetical protein